VLIFPVLHPYYKLDYIKMAWDGADEQEAEYAAGNHNAKNWHDEALKIIENTMQEYWKDIQEDHSQSTAPKPSVSHVSPSDTPTMESMFDHHRHELLEKATHEKNDSLGWAEELCHYLGMIAEDVLRDMDVIAWWVVSNVEVPT